MTIDIHLKPSYTSLEKKMQKGLSAFVFVTNFFDKSCQGYSTIKAKKKKKIKIPNSREFCG